MLVTIATTLTALLAGAIIAWLFARRESRKHGTTPVEEMSGICAVALDQTVRKNSNKAKVMELFNESQSLTNAEVREALGLHRRSIVRYLTELEREGKVRQEGDSGRSVTYHRI